MTLQSLYSEMFRHANAIFRKYIPSLKPFVVKHLKMALSCPNMSERSDCNVVYCCVFNWCKPPVTYSMEQSPSWEAKEANRFAASQEIPCILWNSKVHFRIHNCPPPVSILRSPGPRLCVWIFRNKRTFSRREVVSPSPKPQAGGPPLVCYPRLLIQYIRSYSPYWRPFLHPQPEDGPCRGDRDPLSNRTLFVVICFDPTGSSSG
jgi:hypothetical protein